MPKRGWSEITESYYEDINCAKHEARIRCAVQYVYFYSKLWPVLNNIRESFKLDRCDECAERCEHLREANVMYFTLNSLETAFGVGFMDDVDPTYELFVSIYADAAIIERIKGSPFFNNYHGKIINEFLTLKFVFDSNDRKIIDKIHRLK